MAIGQSADRPIAAEICCLDQIRGIVRILRQRQRDAIEGVQWPSASSTPPARARLLPNMGSPPSSLRPIGAGWVPAPRPSTALTTAGVTRRPPHQGASVGGFRGGVNEMVCRVPKVGRCPGPEKCRSRGDGAGAEDGELCGEG